MGPVALLVCFNRPDLVKRRLFELNVSTLLPEKLVITIDGPRTTEDVIQIHEILRTVNSASFPYPIQLIQREMNLGCTNHVISAVTEILKTNSQVVVIEDDVVIGKNFIQSMSDGLDYIQDHESIGIVGAFSPFREIPFLSFIPVKNYWRKTSYFSAWGWATNAEFWNKFRPVTELDDIQEYLSDSHQWRQFSARKKQVWLNRFERGIWDFNVQMILFKHSMDCLLPFFRLIDNEGFGDSRSTHTKHSRPKTLFGFGASDKLPKFSNLNRCNLINGKIWQFLDSNLWAADGHFNARARTAGIRTILRQIGRKVTKT